MNWLKQKELEQRKRYMHILYHVNISLSQMITYKDETVKMQNMNSVLTCILPTSNENNINPNMEIKTANRTSPMKGLVSRFEPREL